MAWSEMFHTAEHAAGTDAPSPVFDATEPPALRVTLHPDAWSAMRLDMAALLGPFGGKGELPIELHDACAASAVGDACTIAIGSYAIEGACRGAGPTLACLRDPDLVDGVPDPVPGRPLEVRADITLDGRAYPSVGIRFKGNSTLAMAWRSGIDKLPLRLDFGTKEAPGRTLFGVEQVALGNGGRDATLLREHLMAETMRAFGVSAPRIGWVRLERDVGSGAEPAGLYTFVEVPDAKALAGTFGHAHGDLWEADGTDATLERWDPASFEAQGPSDDAVLAEAIEVLDAPARTWLRDAGARWDLDAFVRWLAANTALQNWDAYGVVPHNYYVYVGDDAVARFLPWDLNESLYASRHAPDLTLGTVDERWRLIRPLLDDPVGSAAYQDALDALVAADGPFGEGFDSRVDAAAAYIAQAVADEDPARSLTSPERHAAALEELRAYAQARREEVRAR
jgi:hypothetical protein